MDMKMKTIPRVILLIDTSRGVSRDFFFGIAKYTTTHRQWEFRLRPLYYRKFADQDRSLRWFKKQKADGIIVRDMDEPERLLKLGLPMIVSSTMKELYPGVRRVITNSPAIAKLAADYLTKLGFSRYAFCGFDEFSWSNERKQTFAEEITKKGYPVYVYQQDGRKKKFDEREALSKWIMGLPKPIGLFACNDDRALDVAEVCKVLGIHIPDEVAILGVDNDELVCNLSYCPISSIAIDYYRAGYESADKLDALMKRKEVSSKDIVVNPIRVVERQSTNVFVVADEEVVRAIKFIRENFKRKIQVADVVEMTSLSRRVLEKRFQKALKCSIYEYINRMRVEYIAELLLNTSLPIERIAHRLEFTDPYHLNRLFRKYMNISPSEYRRKYIM